ncbi:MAG: ClpX C4-type zinc finger protein [Bacillota bacterium]
MLKVYQHPKGWLKWVAAGALLLSVVTEWAALAPPSGDRTYIPNLFWPFLALLVLQQARGQRLILTPHVLIVQEALQLHRIPLAAAEIKALNRGWQVRWPVGRITRRLTITAPVSFREEVERAAAEARQADPGLVPVTEKEAARAVLLAREESPTGQGLVILGVVAVMGAAFWLDQPWILLLLPALVLFADRLEQARLVVVAGDQLWVVEPKGGTHGIPLTGVRVRQARGFSLELATDDPTLPTLRLAIRGTDPDFIKQLKQRLGGEAPRFPRTDPDRDPGRPEGPLRCSLCGRPEPGTVAGTGVYICERCSGRARHEANETGHGLTGREPKPM